MPKDFDNFKKQTIDSLINQAGGLNNKENQDVAYMYMEWLADEFVKRMLPQKVETALKIYDFLVEKGFNSSKNEMGEMHGDRYAYYIPTTNKKIKAFHFRDQHAEYLYIIEDKFGEYCFHVRILKSDKSFKHLIKNNFASYSSEKSDKVKYEDCSDMFRYGDCRDSGYIISGNSGISSDKNDLYADITDPKALKMLQKLKEIAVKVEKSLINFHELQYTFSQIDSINYYVSNPDELE